MRILSDQEFTVGKSVVTITTQGCVDCGAKEADSAVAGTTLMFRLGDRNYRIEFKRCGVCDKKRYGGYDERAEPRAESSGRESIRRPEVAVHSSARGFALFLLFLILFALGAAVVALVFAVLIFGVSKVLLALSLCGIAAVVFSIVWP